ncbi:unnamed protein product, partial [Ectocarpus sp. 4 AP-2014]
RQKTFTIRLCHEFGSALLERHPGMSARLRIQSVVLLHAPGNAAVLLLWLSPFVDALPSSYRYSLPLPYIATPQSSAETHNISSQPRTTMHNHIPAKLSPVVVTAYHYRAYYH